MVATKQEKALAEFLHELFCSENHTDGCAWEYEEEKEDKWDNPTHYIWALKARKVIKFLDESCRFFFGVEGV